MGLFSRFSGKSQPTAYELAQAIANVLSAVQAEAKYTNGFSTSGYIVIDYEWLVSWRSSNPDDPAPMGKESNYLRARANIDLVRQRLSDHGHPTPIDRDVLTLEIFRELASQNHAFEYSGRVFEAEKRWTVVAMSSEYLTAKSRKDANEVEKILSATDKVHFLLEKFAGRGDAAVRVEELKASFPNGRVEYS